jgi:hypothetical protein
MVVEHTMVLRAPNWKLYYKSLGSNFEINLKMQNVMDFNQSQLSEEAWISNLAKNPGLAILTVWFW